ncbi:MAG: AFG1 family ATPase [Rhodospirillales bacterium]|nr:AFG1 family ATPase [Rhodospirillales bacterium]
MSPDQPSPPAATQGPLAAYRALVREGAIDADLAQALAAEKLQALANALRNYRPNAGGVSWRERLGLARRREEAAPQGLYLYGPVGRGKSMLMDLFFRSVPLEKKRRVHFYGFMTEVHEALHRRRAEGDSGDAIAWLVEEVLEEAWLLCFDEFQVTNIADAMILGRLFEALFERGLVVVATSNTPPDGLYEGGLQRERFLPFVRLLKARLDLLALEGAVDYRRRRLAEMPLYFAPLGREAHAALVQAWDRLTDRADGILRTLTVKGHALTVPRSTNGVAWVGFEELCERPLGAEDYIALARRFPTVILEGVPVLDAARRDPARRFVALIDALYEMKTKLVASADADPDRLCTDPKVPEFRRAASRLHEMRSRRYLDTPHRERG